MLYESDLVVSDNVPKTIADVETQTLSLSFISTINKQYIYNNIQHQRIRPKYTYIVTCVFGLLFIDGVAIMIVKQTSPKKKSDVCVHKNSNQRVHRRQF